MAMELGGGGAYGDGGVAAAVERGSEAMRMKRTMATARGGGFVALPA